MHMAGPEIWFLLIGFILALMGITSHLVARLPITPAIIYLCLGICIGPWGLGLLRPSLTENGKILELISEVIVILSIYSAGLKLRLPFSNFRWTIIFRLAGGGMILSTLLLGAAGYLFFGLTAGVALLMGAILSPTDPVLASEVQVRGHDDPDRLRVSLTGEAALNDSSAFPMVMLGLGLLGLHPLGEGGLRWLWKDLFLDVGGGLLIGAVGGRVLRFAILKVKIKDKDSVVLEDFLGLGLLSFSYGMALCLNVNGFLAAFAAGLALHRLDEVPQAKDTVAKVTGFNEQVERLGEFAVVIIIGSLLSKINFSDPILWIGPLLLLVVRPLSVLPFLRGELAGPKQKFLFSWFGIRGVGSLFYLVYIGNRGLEPATLERLGSVVLFTVALSILVHGLTATPLMLRYGDAIRLALRRRQKTTL